MTDEQPFYKNSRVLLFIFMILLSIGAILPSYSSGEFHSRLKYGLDLEGGSWLQLRLQGIIVQIDADEKKIIQTEFGRLLNDSLIKVEEITSSSITFTTSKEISKKAIDVYGYGASIVSKDPYGGMRISIQTNKELLIQRYLENRLNAEAVPVPGTFSSFEIRRTVTEEELNSILKPVGGEVVSFRAGVTEKTRDETKRILEDKLNRLGIKEIPIRTVGNDYILIDLAGVDLTTAREIAAKPGKFEIRIQVKGNETEHVLYGNEITGVGVPEKERRGSWGVSFILSDAGARALQDAAVQYGAATNPDEHNLIMYLDENIIFNAPLSADLASTIQSVPVKNLIATTGPDEEGQTKANELNIHLRAGALPVNVEVVGSGQVPAELGSKFKEQVAIAGIIALVVVAIVVYFRYRQPGIIIPMLATSFSEVLMILGFTAIIGFQLDLATITGIIAVIGTGVDHLIIITDEVLSGSSMPPSKVYKTRLTKAFGIIFAAAVTTLIAMSPLLFMGFGALKGFAVITIAGVLIGVCIARPAYAIIIKDLLVDSANVKSEKYVDAD